MKLTFGNRAILDSQGLEEDCLRVNLSKNIYISTKALYGSYSGVMLLSIDQLDVVLIERTKN